MSEPAGRVDRVAEHVYTGVWAVLVRCLRVPDSGPSLPDFGSGKIEVFHPAPGFLKYLKLYFWIVLALIDGLIAGVWLVISINAPVLGWFLLGPMLALAIVPDIVAYIAIHIRYDTTWYAMNNRALRIRRGVWIVHEMTFTFENVQNVKVVSGPVQRLFGIENLEIETAGSGESEQSGSITNKGIIEGVADAHRIRDMIMERVRASKSAGLGDDASGESGGPAMWGAEHIGVLREIAEALRSA